MGNEWQEISNAEIGSNPDAASIDKIMAYEAGELSEQETIDLFQELVLTGDAWRLQGHYGRTATMLISAGLVTPPEGEK